MRMWLDDERNPADKYVQEKYGANPDDVWVKNVEQAKVLVQTGEVTSMSLDYDLCDFETGLDFAFWLAEECEAGRVNANNFNRHGLECHSDMMHDKREGTLFWLIKEPFRRILLCKGN